MTWRVRREAERIVDELVAAKIQMDEADPTGKSPNEPGAKLDAGKNRLGLVLGDFSNALMAVGEVGTFGANKYTDHGWVTVENGVERYTDAMLRHHFKESAGEHADPDSTLSHAAHRAWNALAALELEIRQSFQVPSEMLGKQL